MSLTSAEGRVLTLDLDMIPEGHPSPLGRLERGKKLQAGLVRLEAAAKGMVAFQTQESCSPGSVGKGLVVRRTRWLNRVRESAPSAG